MLFSKSQQKLLCLYIAKLRHFYWLKKKISLNFAQHGTRILCKNNNLSQCVYLIQWFVFIFLMNWFAPGSSKEINSHCIAWLATATLSNELMELNCTAYWRGWNTLSKAFSRSCQSLKKTSIEQNNKTKERIGGGSVFLSRKPLRLQSATSSAVSISSKTCVWEVERGRELQANRVD